jgi:hypothetical protein
MKCRVINKAGKAWDFESVKKAIHHVKKKCRDNYRIEKENGEKIRVYDDTDFDDFCLI